MNNTPYTEMYYIAGNFRLEKKIHLFWPLLSWAKFLSHVNDDIEPMVTFTARVKIYSTKYLCNARGAGLGKIFVQ